MSQFPDSKAYALALAKYIGASQRRILSLFQSALHEASLLGDLIDADPDRPFSFDDYPATKKRSDRLLSDLSRGLLQEVTSAVGYAWDLAERKGDALESAVRGRTVRHHQERALKAFLDRKEAGISLSDRVWRTTQQAKEEIEMSLDLGLRQGQDAASLSRTLREHLREPERLFRRVRDEHGQLHLSQRAQAYHPGRGVYRSSFKNALRLTATETNIAYRTADHLRIQELDFVRGIRVQLSNNHTLSGAPFHCICDDFAGDYPKDFKFTGWHPLCRCFTTTILAGDPDDPDATPAVQDVPQGMKDWVEANGDRIERAFATGKPAYWLRDNAGMFDGKLLDKAVKQTSSLAKTAGEEVQRLAEQAAHKHGATCTPINYKSEASIQRKVLLERKDEPLFQPKQLKDAVRTTIIADEEQIEGIIRELSKDDSFVRWKVQDTELGYKGNIINVQTSSGLVGEIQVLPAKMIYAKEKPDVAKAIIGEAAWRQIHKDTQLEGGLGHAYYEEWRLLAPGSPEAKLIAKRSREYYREVLARP